MNDIQVPPLDHESATPTQSLVNCTVSKVRRQHTCEGTGGIGTGPLRARSLIETAAPENLLALIDLLARAG